MTREKDTLIQICACYSFEHQVIFWWCEEDKMLYAHFHLHTRDCFFKKLWLGLKFAFGYKCKYGAWDEFIFDEENLKQLYEFLLKHKNYGKPQKSR